MTDTTELPDGEEVEAVPSATEELEADETTQEGEELEGEESDEEDEDTGEPEPVEVEIEGRKYKVHPDLRDNIMLRADYTRKTQETAQMRKELETRITEANEASEAEVNARANLVAIDAALQQFQQVDWDALERHNPAEANRLFRNFTLLQQQKGGAENELKEARDQREAGAKQVFAERFEQSMTELKQAIPDWGESKAVTLKQFAYEQFGFTDEEFRMGLHDPRQIKMLNLAYAAAQSKNKPKVPKPAIKPASTVKGSAATGRKDPNKMTPEEFHAWRGRA